MSKSKKKGLLRAAGEAVGVFAAEIVVGTEKAVEVAGDKLVAVKRAITNFGHKKTAVKKVAKKVSKKAVPKKASPKKAAPKKAASKKAAPKKAVRKVTRKPRRKAK